MKTAHEVFQETLKELGFSGHKPDQMTNSDYWLCTCTAMEKFAQQYGQALLQKASEEENAESVIEDENGLIHIDVNSILNTKLDLI